MTREEKMAIFELAWKAEEAGDEQLAESLYDLIPLAPRLGRCLAESIGYERAKELGANFDEVDEAYGPNWHIGL